MIKTFIWKMLIYSNASANQCVECLHAVCNAHNRLACTGQSEKPENLLTGAKPTVAHIRPLRCKVWVIFLDKAQHLLETNARSRILLRSLFDRKYRVVIESDKTGATSTRYLIEEDVFPVRGETRVFLVNIDDMEESAVEKDEELVCESNLKLHPLPVGRLKTSERIPMTASPTHVAEAQDSGCYNDVRERSTSGQL